MLHHNRNAMEAIAESTVPVGGLLESIRPQYAPLSGVTDALRERFAPVIERCFVTEGNRAFFREAPDGNAPVTPRALICGLRMAMQLDARAFLARLRNEKEKFSQQIGSWFNPETGLYEGGDTQEAGRIGAWRLHDGILYVRQALRVLGLPQKPFPHGAGQAARFPWAPIPGASVREWMERVMEAVDERAAVKEITQYLCLYRNLTGLRIDEHMREILAFLFFIRDPETGYIGRAADLGWAMRGHRNNVLVFTLNPMGLREPLEWQVRVMKSTLATQRDDGLFHDGGMCANMDAIQLLAEYCLQTGRLERTVLSAIERCIVAMFRLLQSPEGGFHFTLEQAKAHPQGEGTPWLMSGTGFLLESLRFWQALSPQARPDLHAALQRIGAV